MVAVGKQEESAPEAGAESQWSAETGVSLVETLPLQR